MNNVLIDRYPWLDAQGKAPTRNPLGQEDAQSDVFIVLILKVVCCGRSWNWNPVLLAETRTIC